MPDQLVPRVVPAGAGMSIRGPAGGALTFQVRGEDTDGALTVFENVIAPLDGPPLHRHAHEDESWYVLEGDLRFRFDADILSAPQGSFVFVPRGVPHCFQNVGATPARILVIFNPAGMERFFDRFDALPPGPVALETWHELAAEVGMEILGPPLAQSDPL